jgi:hypothetical protein
MPRFRPLVVTSVRSIARPTALTRPLPVPERVAPAPAAPRPPAPAPLRTVVPDEPLGTTAGPGRRTVVPGQAVPAAASVAAVVKRVEARRPLHLPVIVGISAGLYAGSLVVASGLQFAADRQAIADRQPVADAIGVLGRHHDTMATALQAATARYGDAVAAYGDLSSDTQGLQERLARLTHQVAAIEAMTIAGPSLDGSATVVSLPPRSSGSKTTGSPSTGSAAAANPPPAGATVAAPALAPALAPAPAPPPPVAATNGASAKP